MSKGPVSNFVWDILLSAQWKHGRTNMSVGGKFGMMGQALLGGREPPPPTSRTPKCAPFLVLVIRVFSYPSWMSPRILVNLMYYSVTTGVTVPIFSRYADRPGK